ncbi:MAG TPA: SurA N-terminal domain-containing protein [Dongiaceae bacterium]|nr:SurA N-terminal domain-containing protein [Dongiaceae bacterium]
MLSTIRHKTASWIAKVLFVILIFAFGAWGVGDIFRGSTKSAPIAKIGNLEYSQAELSHDLRQTLQQYQRQYPQLTMQQLKALGIAQKVVDQGINEKLFQVYAKQLDIAVPNSMVLQTIQVNPAFQGPDGKFSRQQFLSVLGQMGSDEAGFVTQMRQSLQNRMLFRALFGSSEVPQQLTNEIYGYQAETRAADTLVIPAASVTNIPQPDDAALTQFHKDHGKEYMRPEYRAANVLLLSPNDFMKDVTVSDQDVAQAYDAHKAEYSTPETRDIEQIVVQDPAVADKVLGAMKGGKTFSAAVKDVTGNAPIDLGTHSKDTVQPKELQDPAFALAEDAVSAPIKTAFGTHLLHVKAITPGNTQTLDQVKDQLRNNLALGKANDSLVGILNQLDDALGGGASVADAAQKLNLPLKKVDAVDSLGNDKEGKDAGLRPEVTALIQQTESGSTSQVVPLQDGAYAVVQVTGVTPPELKPLAEIKDQVAKDWTLDQQRQAVAKQAKQIIDKLHNGGSLADQAKALNLTLKHSASFARNVGDQDSGIAVDLAQKLFAAKIGDYVDGETTDGAVAAQLTGITPAIAADHKDDAKLVSDKLLQDLRFQLTDEFSTALQQQIPVTRDDQQVDKALSEE